MEMLVREIREKHPRSRSREASEGGCHLAEGGGLLPRI